jgi:hypothetical protein
MLMDVDEEQKMLMAFIKSKFLKLTAQTSQSQLTVRDT